MRHYFLVGLPDVEPFITNYKLIKYDLWLSSFIILREKRSNNVRESSAHRAGKNRHIPLTITTAAIN